MDSNFAKQGKGDAIEAIHPYPAKFIAGIPRAVLSALPIPINTAVFDPFCGSGTTLTEAQRLGLPSVGIDLNPIACLISRVKTAPPPPRFEREAAEIVVAARSNCNPERWDIPNVDHWFKPEIQEALAALIQGIRARQVSQTKDALCLALSSILVRVSNQESATRYAAVEKSVTKMNVFDYFLTACGKISRALAARSWSIGNTKPLFTRVPPVPCHLAAHPPPRQSVSGWPDLQA